ncbi:hypothetical protein ACTD5D_34330 [Nocardia takedensis]|uniref:hypothetical protein n=1 Tax=Nocardia takedensis TaxID=259390 RepID=UPI0005953CBD|nr:hypothetical protein [Nocardia takedensis]
MDFFGSSDIPAGVIARDESLWGDRVRLLARGELVGLPSPSGCGVFYRGWIHAAHSPHRPSGLAVVESARSVLRAMTPVETTAELPAITTAHD